MVTAPAKRELVQWMVTQGLSERRCLGVVGDERERTSRGRTGTSRYGRGS
jgi:hypothetical protein